jgi:hypothetical protein
VAEATYGHWGWLDHPTPKAQTKKKKKKLSTLGGGPTTPKGPWGGFNHPQVNRGGSATLFFIIILVFIYFLNMN